MITHLYVNVQGDVACFAGPVTTTSNPAGLSNWLFAKVYDFDEPGSLGDQAWGIFSNENDSMLGAVSKTTPGTVFNVLEGNLQVHTY